MIPIISSCLCVHSVMSDSLGPQGLWPTRLLCPWNSPGQNTRKGKESESCSVVSNSLRPRGLHSSWNSPDQNTGVGSLSLLQGIFPSQGSNPGLLRWRRILYQPSYKNTRVGCYPSLGEIFPAQGSTPGLLHWQADSLPLAPLGKKPDCLRSVCTLPRGCKEEWECLLLRSPQSRWGNS